MTREPNETKHTHLHMKKLILIFFATFGFAYDVSAQDTTDTRNMLDFGTSAEISAWELRCEITDAVESGTCAVTVRYQSDYFPVKFIQDGKVLNTTNSTSDSIKVEGVRYEILPHGGMKYIIEVRNPRGATFLVNREAPKDSEDKMMSYEDDEEEVITYDYRTPKKVEVDSVEVLPPKLPDPDFDLISIEYVYKDELPETPVRVISLGQDGRSFTRNVNRFYTGFRVDDKGNVMVGVEVMATPYMVSPGETIYRVKLIMADGKSIKRKVVVLTDQP